MEDKYENNDLMNHPQVIKQPSLNTTLNTTLESVKAQPLLLFTPSITDGDEDLQQSFSSDGKSVDKTDVFIYDNLIDQIAISTKPGKDRFKFGGSLVELQEFTKLVLKIDGQWTVGKDKNLNIFRSKCKQVIINYWISTKTLTLNGEKEGKIKSKIKERVLVHQLANPQMRSSPNFQDGRQHQTQRMFQATPHTENHSDEFENEIIEQLQHLVQLIKSLSRRPHIVFSNLISIDDNNKYTNEVDLINKAGREFF